MWQVKVREDWTLDQLQVLVREDMGDARQVLRPDGSWELVQRGTPYEAQPSFTLPMEAGRALLDALVRQYQGAEDTRALRKDYDAERARVDKMLAAMLPAVTAPR